MHPLLGHFGRDTVTGFAGTIVGHIEYLTGCNQALLVPPVDKDGKLVDGQWFDVQRVAVDFHKGKITLDNGETPGADHTPKPRNI